MNYSADPGTALPRPFMAGRLVAVAFACLGTAVSLAAEPLATGKAFERQLELPLTANWGNVSFREVVDSLIAARQVAVLVDRRIDSDEPFTLRCAGDSLFVSLKKIAAQKQVGVSILHSVAYFGPTKAAEQLRTVAGLRHEEVVTLPASSRRLLAHASAGGWPELSEPRLLVESLAKEAHVKVLNPELISHDLWPAVRLPVMPWYDRLTLVLVQFGLTFEVREDGKAIELLPIPDGVQLVKTYPGGADARSRAAKLAKLVPKALVKEDRGKLIVSGRDEDHAEIAALLAGKQVHETTVMAGKDLYKLNIQGLPLEKVLTQVGEMLKLELEFDRESIAKSDISLDQLISFQVENANLDELLTAALKETGLEYERKGKTVKIKPSLQD